MITNKCIPYTKIHDYIKALSKDYIIYFPIKENKEINFTSDISLVDKFHWGLSHIPPKNFFIPPKEILFNYQNGNPKETKINNLPKIIFGLHPYDIKAISILDKIFLEKYPDSYYKRRRKNFYIIGMGDYEFEYYFKPDIFLNSNADVYDVIIKNDKAKKLIDYKGILKNSTFEGEKEYFKEDPLFANIKLLSRSVEKSHDSKIWDEIAKIDLGCGVCSYTCPLCYCFDIENKLTLDDKCQATKCRIHSSCYHKNFAKISSKNYKNELRERIYNWYHHKFVRMPREIGHVGCVDCGRCVRYCPAKINFKNVLKSLIL